MKKILLLAVINNQRLKTFFLLAGKESACKGYFGYWQREGSEMERLALLHVSMALIPSLFIFDPDFRGSDQSYSRKLFEIIFYTSALINFLNCEKKLAEIDTSFHRRR